jgi:hypothetical protein
MPPPPFSRLSQTVFITTSGNTVLNVAPLRFMLEATYRRDDGGAAVEDGQSRRGRRLEIPSVKSTVVAFDASAKSVKRTSDRHRLYRRVGCRRGEGGARRSSRAPTTSSQRRCGGAGLQAAGPKVHALSANKNQNDVSRCGDASAVADIPTAFVQVAREVKDGNFVGQVEKKGMRDGVVTLVVNPRLAATIPDEVKQRVGDAQKAIVAGTLQVPTSEF